MAAWSISLVFHRVAMDAKGVFVISPKYLSMRTLAKSIADKGYVVFVVKYSQNLVDSRAVRKFSSSFGQNT